MADDRGRTPDDDELVPLLEDETPDPRDAAAVDAFGNEHLDRRMPPDDIVSPGYLARPMVAEVVEPERPTKFADDGGYDLSDDEPDEEARPTRKRRRRDLDPGGTVDVEQACRKCGYNLLGLPRDGRCPECGTRIPTAAEASRLDELAFADDAWLKRVALGCRITLWTGVIWFFGGMVLAFAGVPVVVEAALGGAAAVGVSLGVWLLASPEPSPVPGPERVRLALRGLGIIGASTVLADVAAATIVAGQPAPPVGGAGWTPPVILEFASALLTLAWTATVYPASAFYVGHLARRGREPGVVDRADTVWVALAATLTGAAVLIAAVLGLSVAAGGPLNLGLALLLGCVGLLLLVLVLVFGGMYLILMGEAAQMLDQAASGTTNAGGSTDPEAIRRRECEILEARRRKVTYRIGR